MKTMIRLIIPALILCLTIYGIWRMTRRTLTKSVKELPKDPRLEAAHRLLCELEKSNRKEVVQAAQEIKKALEDGVQRLAQLQQSMKEYQTMGEETDKLANVLQKQEETNQALFTVVKELHFMVSTEVEEQQPLPDSVQQLLLQLKANQEVDRI